MGTHYWTSIQPEQPDLKSRVNTYDTGTLEFVADIMQMPQIDFIKPITPDFTAQAPIYRYFPSFIALAVMYQGKEPHKAPMMEIAVARYYENTLGIGTSPRSKSDTTSVPISPKCSRRAAIICNTFSRVPLLSCFPVTKLIGCSP